MAVAPGIHIVEEFEKSFQDCLAVLTNFDLHNARDPDEIRTSVDLTVQRFIDVSKQMDCFFLQKRLLLSVQKPEHLLVENIQELAAEVKRKDELIEKYNNKIQTWQTLLQDASGGTPRQPLPAQPQPPPPPPPPPNVTTLQGSPSQMPPQVVQQPGAATHGHHMMHPHNIPPMTSSPAPIQPGMLMQSQQMHPQQHMGGAQQQGGLQGPLAYLERTMSNIGHL
ncbi:mediator of RNA polymerase II transcription subunit 28 [Caerostris extrusa]|uniref:Mediator of RNA polymerase II transcription subunit 28 n=1 Tax=Caerostris extrusa TaxID=172846 RepID=A0AAV4TWJ6_CAEEX|nr:mediator of RNA polymerase II transcription subunit 28 [Caerostris extrusa]